MARKRDKGVATEPRPYATSEEVMGAFMDGRLAGLFIQKRVSLRIAEDTLSRARRILRDVPDDDPRIRPLVRYIEKEKTGAPRRANQTLKYKAQRNKQRRTAFIHLPLDIFGDDVQAADVTFTMKGPNGKPQITVVRAD